MPQDLTTTSSSSTISRREAEAKIEAYHGSLAPVEGHPTKFCVSRAEAPSSRELQLFSAVQSRLEAELKPCANRTHVEAVINRLLMGFDIGNGPSDENTVTLNGEFVEACSKAGLPLAAIVEAADRFRSATTLIPRPNHRFRPMPPEFVAEAREGMVPIRTKLLHVRRLLAAEVYDPPTPEQRAEVEEARAAAAAYLTKRMPQADERPVLAEPVDGPRTGFDIVAPLKGLDVSHLMANLDRKRVSA